MKACCGYSLVCVHTSVSILLFFSNDCTISYRESYYCTIVASFCLKKLYIQRHTIRLVLYWIGVRGVFVSGHDTLGCFTPETWDRFQYSLTTLKPAIYDGINQNKYTR